MTKQARYEISLKNGQFEETRTSNKTKAKIRAKKINKKVNTCISAE